MIITRCRSCNAEIVFLPTSTGKTMPIDAATVKHADQVFDPDGEHISHFATCSRAQDHRKLPRRGRARSKAGDRCRAP